MKIWIIYKITSPSNKIYVGQTKNLKSRLSNYKRLRCKKQVKLYNSLKKYGWDNHIFEIIEDGINSLNDSNNREIYWIKQLDCYKNGLNCNSGGTGHCPSLKEETKRKISEGGKKAWAEGKNIGFTGGTLSIEHKNKILQANLGVKRSAVSIEKMKTAYHNRTKEQIQTYLDAMHARKGYHQTEETREKIKNTRKEKIKNGKISFKTKKVKCLNNNIIYISATEAAKKLNLLKNAISQVCSGKRNSLYGYKFTYDVNYK